jgi:hypothetical protein
MAKRRRRRVRSRWESIKRGLAIYAAGVISGATLCLVSVGVIQLVAVAALGVAIWWFIQRQRRYYPPPSEQRHSVTQAIEQPKRVRSTEGAQLIGQNSIEESHS